MFKNSSHLALTFVLVLAVLGPMFAQDRATMSAPIIRSSGEEIVFSVRFENLAKDRSYRLGFGGAGEKAPAVQVELSKGDSPASVEAADFIQGNTSGWWQVEQVTSKGFTMAPPNIPGEGEVLVLKVTVSRDEADQFEKFYIFVSRNYGSDRWYLEDGSEIDQTDW